MNLNAFFDIVSHKNFKRQANSAKVIGRLMPFHSVAVASQIEVQLWNVTLLIYMTKT